MMFIILCTLVAVAKASEVAYQSPYLVSTGTSQQYRNQDVSGNYRFGYDESHASGGTFRDETGDAYGNKYGSYGLREADGRYRVVNYVADENGFRADVKSNEPGVAPKAPASTTFTTTSIEKPVLYAEKSTLYPAEKPSFYAESPSMFAEHPLLYAAPSPAFGQVIHHAYNPEYPLLYQYRTPYYQPYGTYKGTPFRRYGTYYSKKGSPVVATKGSPMVSKVTQQVVSTKGSPFVSAQVSPVVPAKGSPFVSTQVSHVVSAKGSPFVSTKGSPVVSTKGAPLISRQGYFIYP